MNSLEITAYKAFVAHRKAFDTWENGCGGKYEQNT